MNLLNSLVAQPFMVILIACILGLIIGSFLNVVIYRLPIMMEREWRKQCAELLQVTTHETPEINLIGPRSHCPKCGHSITAWENIPLISYLWQAGKCRGCQQPIAKRYPIVEALSALLAIIVAWQLGIGWALGLGLIFTWALLVISVIDLEHQLIPDSIVLPLLWLGLLCNYFGLFTAIHASVLGAMAGYLSLWSVYWLFKGMTGKEGMGYGDFKLLAMLGAWLGWQALVGIILMASLAGALIGIILIVKKQQDKNTPYPFGPYLAIAGWLNLLWGKELSFIFGM